LHYSQEQRRVLTTLRHRQCEGRAADQLSLQARHYIGAHENNTTDHCGGGDGAPDRSDGHVRMKLHELVFYISFK